MHGIVDFVMESTYLVRINKINLCISLNRIYHVKILKDVFICKEGLKKNIELM